MMSIVPLLLAAAAIAGWSDPIPFASTTTAVPPAVAVVGDRVHVFWLNRPAAAGNTGDLWHVVLAPDGRRVGGPSRLRSSVDTRLAFPAAVAWGNRIAAAWMARSPEGVTVEIALLEPDGALRTILRPDPVWREEAGRITLSAWNAAHLDAAWSQFDRAERQIRYTRIETALSYSPPVVVTRGDAPAIHAGREPRLVWWEPVGAGDFRLMTGLLRRSTLTDRRALSGSIALVAPLPVLFADTDGVDVVLIPTLERAFSTSGRLYAIRIGQEGALPARVPMLGQARVSDVSVATGDGAAIVWSQAVGRRQNSELFAARLSPGRETELEPPIRLTYTSSGSLKPAAAVVAGSPAAVWLEVTGFGEFSLSFGTSAIPRRHRFLLGITELDLFRPGPLLTFGVLAAISVAPLALLLTVVTLLPGALLVAALQPLMAPFRRLDEFVHRPAVRIVAIVAATAAVQLAARSVIPGRPSPALLLVPIAGLGGASLAFLARRDLGPIGRGLVVTAAFLISGVIALFPWGAAQLSQF